ncbi:MAG: hypothetical protein F083_2756 [bacterium F083]|jgi:transcriptional regulator with XRE-family HTH domain|nr:MAG: hypothetical protein F083_2756 [bacterium F083]
MDELKTVGYRLKLIRNFLQLTQNEVAKSTNTSQAAISRIEHGEEVYASVLISIIKYYSTHIDIGRIFNPNFEISPNLLLSSQDNSIKKELSRKIDTIKEELDEAHITGISHLEFVKKLIMDI